ALELIANSVSKSCIAREYEQKGETRKSRGQEHHAGAGSLCPASCVVLLLRSLSSRRSASRKTTLSKCLRERLPVPDQLRFPPQCPPSRSSREDDSPHLRPEYAEPAYHPSSVLHRRPDRLAAPYKCQSS